VLPGRVVEGVLDFEVDDIGAYCDYFDERGSYLYLNDICLNLHRSNKYFANSKVDLILTRKPSAVCILC